MNQITPYCPHPATVWCAHCGQPIEITMSSSVDPVGRIHARCWTDWKRNNNEKETP